MAKILNLRMLRKSLGMTQNQLSAELNLAQGYISELEMGKKQVTNDVITKLHDRFGVGIVDQWMQEAPIVQQSVGGGENNKFTATGDVGATDTVDAVPMEAFNKMLDEIAEQRKIVSKSQEQIDRLLNLLEGTK